LRNLSWQRWRADGQVLVDFEGDCPNGKRRGQPSVPCF
jgi:hypothetical protein